MNKKGPCIVLIKKMVFFTMTGFTFFVCASEKELEKYAVGHVVKPYESMSFIIDGLGPDEGWVQGYVKEQTTPFYLPRIYCGPQKELFDGQNQEECFLKKEIASLNAAIQASRKYTEDLEKKRWALASQLNGYANARDPKRNGSIENKDSSLSCKTL